MPREGADTMAAGMLPVTWVPPGDSDEEYEDPHAALEGEHGSARAEHGALRRVEDPLLGRKSTPEVMSRLAAAYRQHGPAVNMRSDAFDPALYVSRGHKDTPL